MTTIHKTNMRPNIKEKNKPKPLFIQGIKNQATRFKNQTHNKKTQQETENKRQHPHREKRTQ
jgi:hypothetical protein